MRWPLLAALLAAPALALSPFEKNHPLVEQGTEAYDRQDYERALERYEAAAQQRPRDPRVQYDRGLALEKLGRHDEARQALLRAEELDEHGELKGKIHYDLGNIAAAQGDKRGAVGEYRKALRANPEDALARHNLEVLLRDLPPRQSPQGQDGGTPDGGPGQDGGRPDAGLDGGVTDGGSDAGRPDGGPKDGGEGDGGSADAGQGDGGAPDGGGDGGSADGGNRGDGGQGDAGQSDAGQGQQDQSGDAGEGAQGEAGDGGQDAGQASPDAGASSEALGGRDAGADLDRQEAEKLLDSFKSNEKNLQLWRFRKQTQRNDTHGKDW